MVVIYLSIQLSANGLRERYTEQLLKKTVKHSFNVTKAPGLEPVSQS
ncbi:MULTISPECIES: hypothetical protein [unclassified Moorena]|nr:MULTISPECIES: hypothetical protein [unclassified Moorena]NEQ05489.1 hypothetical protein [Moorena sp. SIO4E2]NEQ18539.1 hypothetical protein [Moorena sp. SIO3E2]NES42912.1 hypothetical protein [Moorena sp. SIO2C4]